MFDRPPVKKRKRRRGPERYVNQLCVRLSDKQLSLLQVYAEHRGYLSEVDALRFIIDGLEGWFERISDDQSITSPEPQAKEESDSGPIVETSDAPEDDAAEATGDFAGRVMVQLPDPRLG